MNIQIKDNFFSYPMYNKIIDECKDNWRTANKGVSVYKDLTDDFYTKECVRFISILFHKKFDIVRASALGVATNYRHRHHYDMTNKTTHTALFYVNQNWEPRWNGGTYFGEKLEQYVQFIPNRMVLFDVHNLKHCGSSFIPEAMEFRYILIWHLKEIKNVS